MIDHRNKMPSITLKTGRDKSLRRRHPWIFSGAIAHIHNVRQNGDTVDIFTSDGKWCGRGAYSSFSQIAVRMWTFNPNELIDIDFFRRRLSKAFASRYPQKIHCGDSSVRLVYAESDGLPGLIVDRYADFLVCQFLTAGTEFWRDTIVAVLNELIPCTGIYERSDISSRDKEGLPQRNGVLYGKPPPDLVEINNGRFSFLIDMKRGHKTGFYLDQRDNRRQLGKYARGADVLDCFAYTGGFTVAALKGGATHVTCIEDSAEALDLIRRNVALNNLDLSQAELERGDVFQILRRYRDARRKFDLVILDPPKFAASRADIRRAGSGYKDINLLACKLLKPAGILATFSCSQHISLDLFQKTVAYAALDADRDVQILEWLHQSSDHPIALNFPEGNYLKGLICKVW